MGSLRIKIPDGGDPKERFGRAALLPNSRGNIQMLVCGMVLPLGHRE